MRGDGGVDKIAALASETGEVRSSSAPADCAGKSAPCSSIEDYHKKRVISAGASARCSIGKRAVEALARLRRRAM